MVRLEPLTIGSLNGTKGGGERPCPYPSSDRLENPEQGCKSLSWVVGAVVCSSEDSQKKQGARKTLQHMPITKRNMFNKQSRQQLQLTPMALTQGLNMSSLSPLWEGQRGTHYFFSTKQAGDEPCFPRSRGSFACFSPMAGVPLPISGGGVPPEPQVLPQAGPTRFHTMGQLVSNSFKTLQLKLSKRKGNQLESNQSKIQPAENPSHSKHASQLCSREHENPSHSNILGVSTSSC